MYEAFRVRKPFEWRGWSYAPRPNGACGCECGPKGLLACVGITGSSCACRGTICGCGCGIPKERYAGDIWLVEEGHPRKGLMVDHRFAGSDGSIPSVDDLMKEARYRQLVSPWKPGKRVLVAA